MKFWINFYHFTLSTVPTVCRALLAGQREGQRPSQARVLGCSHPVGLERHSGSQEAVLHAAGGHYFADPLAR